MSESGLDEPPSEQQAHAVDRFTVPLANVVPKLPEMVEAFIEEFGGPAIVETGLFADLRLRLDTNRHKASGVPYMARYFGSPKLIQPSAYNGTSDEMVALGRFFREQGFYTFVRWNTFFTNPPLCINEQQLREAFEIIDRGLEITDKAVVD